jgi:hypothetical protein
MVGMVMGIINFLLQLHAANLRRKIMEHKKNNPEVTPIDRRRANLQMIEQSRRRMQSDRGGILGSSPFDTQ